MFNFISYNTFEYYILSGESFVQESLYDTVQKLKAAQKVNVEELEDLLESDLEEVVSLCKKACLKPKTDSMGNAYFTGEDVDVLKKMKELYNQSQNIQSDEKISKPSENEEKETSSLETPKKINFLTKAKNRMKSLSTTESPFGLQGSLQKLENNLITKISDMLSEKMDGFDEIIVELIRSKTENENLRTQINDLNKQVFILKKELSSYIPLPLGFYTKKNIDEDF